MSKKWNLGKILEMDAKEQKLPKEEVESRIAAIFAAAQSKDSNSPGNPK